jgi:hypothetical protein
MMDEEQNLQDPAPPPGFEPIDPAQAQAQTQTQDQATPPPPPGFKPVGGGTDKEKTTTPAREPGPVEDFKREHPWIAPGINALQGVGSGVFSTLHGLDQMGAKAWSTISGTPEQSNIIPQSWTQPPPGVAGPAGKIGEQVAEYLLPSGWLGKANKAVEAARLPWLTELGAKATIEAIPAYGITLAQTGGDTDAARNAAVMAFGVTSALPLIGAVYSHATGATTGAGEYVVKRALQNPTPELQAAMRGEISEAEILANTRQAVANVAQKRSADYIARLGKIDPTIRVDLTPARRATNDLLSQFRVRRIFNPQTQKVELDFTNSHLWSDPAAQQQVRTLWDKMMSPMAQDPRSVDALKRGVDAMYSEGGQARAIVQGVKDRLRDSLNKSVPGYQEMTREYAEASDFLDNLTELSTGAKNDGTAIRKLAGALKQNNNYRKDLLEALDAYTGKDLVGQVAGSRLSSWNARGITAAFGVGAGVHHFLQDPMHLISGGTLAVLFGMSPRAVGEAAVKAGAASRLTKAAAASLPSQLRITGKQPNYGKSVFDTESGQPPAPTYGKSVFDQFAGGGKVRYDDGGDVDNADDYDPSNDPVLREIERRRRAQLGYSPSTAVGPGSTVGTSSQDPAAVRALERGPAIQLYQKDRKAAAEPGPVQIRPPVDFRQQPFKINPEAAKRGLYGDYKPSPEDTGGATIEAAGSPSIGERLWAPVREGQIGRAFGISTETPEARKEEGPSWNAPLLRFEAGVPEQGIPHDIAQMASGMTTPANLGLMAATGGVGALEGQVGSSLLSNLISAGFSADMIKGAYDQIPQAREAWNRGDYEGLKRILVQMGTQAGMGVMAGAHALKSTPGTVGLRELPGKMLEGMPTAEAFDAMEAAARARLRANGAFEPGMTSYMGPGGLQHIKDIAALTGAQLGSGVRATGEAAAARARQIQAYMQEWRRRTLTPELQDAFQKTRDANPEINEVGDYMTPLEVQKVLASPKQVEAMSRLLRVLPQSEKMTAMAAAGTDKVGWYRGSAQALQDVFGADAPRFAQLLAALSPRISVEGNLTNALNVWKNWVKEGRPTDRDSIIRIMAKSVQGGGTEKSAMEAWRNNAHAALSAEDPMSLTLSGPKVDSFQRNLRDHVFHVTNDAWMANAYNVAQDLFQGQGANTAAGNPGMTTEYAGASARLRAGAAQAGMYPSQGQEAIWSVAMQLYELGRKYNLDPRDVLQKGLLTPEAIRGTPDFSSLLRHPEYLKILDEAGYGDQARAMTPFVFDQAQKANLTPAQQQLLMEAAGTINETMSMRDRESRSGQFALPKGWTRKIPKATSKSEKSLATRQEMLEGLYPPIASGVTNIETIPGQLTGHLPDIAELPVSGREHYTSTTYGTQQDLANRDIIQKASGLETIPSRNVQGAYLNAIGQARYKAGLPLRPQDIESHPGRALGYETPLEWDVPEEKPGQPIPYTGRLQPSMNPQAKTDLEAAMATHALINAQEAVGSNVLVPTPEEYRAAGNYDVPPEPTMKDFVVPLDEKIEEARIRKAAKQYPQYGLADAGHDMHVLGLGNDIKYTDALKIQKLLGGKSFQPAENIGTYVDLADKWNNLWGSREVTGEVLNRVNQMSPAAYAKLDQDVRQVAGDASKNYSTFSRTKNTPVRPDLMNALDIISKYGLQGLQAAYNNKAFLPGIAAAVLLPPLLKSANEARQE